jgi:hypothetical protein
LNAALVPEVQFFGSGSGRSRSKASSRVFFDATSPRARGYWQPALAQGIDEADAFVLLVGEKALGPWPTLEYYEAHDKHVKSPEFPVVLSCSPGMPRLGCRSCASCIGS